MGERALGCDSAATAAAEKVDGCAKVEQGIGRGTDAVNARNRIEDDVLLLGERVGHDACEFEGAEL